MTTSEQREATEKLCREMVDMFNASGLNTNARVIIVLDLLLSVLASIKCGDCRRLQADAIQDELMPHLLAEALSWPSERKHVHCKPVLTLIPGGKDQPVDDDPEPPAA